MWHSTDVNSATVASLMKIVVKVQKLSSGFIHVSKLCFLILWNADPTFQVCTESLFNKKA
jgi:hypothetical protein